MRDITESNSLFLLEGVAMLVLCVYERSTFDFRVGKQMIQDSVMLKVVRSDLLLTEFNAYVTLKDHKDVRLLTYLTNKNKPIW